MVRSWCSKGWQYWLLVLGCSLKLTHQFLLWHHWHSAEMSRGGEACWLPPGETARACLWHDDQQLHQIYIPFSATCFIHKGAFNVPLANKTFLRRRSSIKHLKTTWCQNSSKLLWWCVLNVLIWAQPFPGALRYWFNSLGVFCSVFWCLMARDWLWGRLWVSTPLGLCVQWEWAFESGHPGEDTTLLDSISLLVHILLFSERGNEVWCVSNSRSMLCVPVRVCGFRKAPYMDPFGDKKVSYQQRINFTQWDLSKPGNPKVAWAIW